MTVTIDIVCPTLGRPDRLAKFVDNVHWATTTPHIVTFVAETHDTATVAAVEAIADSDVRLLFNRRKKNVLGAFNTAAAAVTAPWWFGAGDDIEFSQGWDDAVFQVIADHPEAKVIGTNDLHNPYVLNGNTATHMLINTEYINTFGGTLDLGPGIVCSEEYHHNFFDTELIEVARQRGVWQPCLDAKVEHNHWIWGKSHYDDTYRHSYLDGQAEQVDREIWARRRQLLEDPLC